MAKIRRGRALIPPPGAPLIGFTHCHPTRSTAMQTFAKLALAAGACALGLGAVAPAQAADMAYPEAQAGYPAPPPGYYAPPPVQQGYYPPSAARCVWLSAAAARRIRHLRRAALRRGAGTVLRAGAVLARLRASLCLWLRALARLTALVSSAERFLIRHARPRAGHPRLNSLSCNKRRGWPGQARP